MCLIGLVLVGGCWIVGYINLCNPHPDFTTTPLSLADFNGRFPHAEELKLPRSAANIFYAQSCGGFQGWTQLYRFDAPVSDCIAFGNRLLQENRFAPQQPDAPKVSDMTPLTSSPAPIKKEALEAMGLGKVDWFDVETIRSGFEGQVGSMSPNGMFWIDMDRGRFYFYSLD
ncbi:MAG: hypothetical protein LLF97_04690 [Planctomycetaceae bacterium]|nr:hypothetical protein [Planctomycetaceae bacterium]